MCVCVCVCVCAQLCLTLCHPEKMLLLYLNCVSLQSLGTNKGPFAFLASPCESGGSTLVFPGGSGGKASAYNAGDPGSIPGSGGSPGEGNGDSLQYSCLENPLDGGTW